jgi:hypothetical protein
MAEQLTVSLVDREAAIRGDTRRDVFRKLAAGGTVVTGGLVLGGVPAVALGQSARRDVAILNFALLLEYLESEFYLRAVANGILSGELLEFAATALALEDTGVGAYNGQGSNLRRRTLPAAASIVSVEARHAAWIRRLVAGPDYDAGRRSLPAPTSFDPLLSKAEVQRIVEDTGFIQA